MAKEIKTLRTERLLLRGIDETDAGLIIQLRADPAVFRYFRSPHRITLEEHLDWYFNKYLDDSSRVDWVCIEKASGKRIGVFGLCKEADSAEVNYLLAKESQHKGYAAEAIRALMRYAAEDWRCVRLTAEIHEENGPSVRLAERLGFRLLSHKKPFAVYGIEVDQSDSDQNGCE